MSYTWTSYDSKISYRVRNILFKTERYSLANNTFFILFYISFTPPARSINIIHSLKISRFIFIRKTWFTFYSCCSRTYPGKATVHSLWQEHKDQSYCCVRKSWLCIHEHFVWNVTIVKAPQCRLERVHDFPAKHLWIPNIFIMFLSLTYLTELYFVILSSIWNFMTK